MTCNIFNVLFIYTYVISDGCSRGYRIGDGCRSRVVPSSAPCLCPVRRPNSRGRRSSLTENVCKTKLAGPTCVRVCLCVCARCVCWFTTDEMSCPVAVAVVRRSRPSERARRMCASGTVATRCSPPLSTAAAATATPLQVESIAELEGV